MVERSRDGEHIWAHEATPNASPRLHRMLDRAIESAELAASHIYTLGDWIAPLDEASADRLGLLLVAMFLAVDEGSLAVELSAASLLRRLDGLAERGELEPWIDEALATAAFEYVIGDGRREADLVRRPLLIWDNAGRRYLYFQKYLVAEAEADKRLRQLAARVGTTLDDTAVSIALADVLQRVPLCVNGTAVTWDVDQLTALGLALLRDLVVISGGPGTGKTSVVFTLLRCLARLGTPVERIALAAPTGRAAQRLSDSLRAGVSNLRGDVDARDRALGERTAVTLHRLLDYFPGRDIFRRHEENPIPADVVLVDEVSMVSVEMMAGLLRAIGPKTKLILLGDKDQLPSVDAGAVLGQLAPESDAPALSEPVRRQIERWLPAVGTLTSGPDHWLRDSVTLLRTNHRSEQRIQTTARAINAQQVEVIDTLPRFTGDWTAADGGCWWWEQTLATAAEIRAQLHRWAEHVYDEPLPGGGTFLERIQERKLGDRDLDTDEGRDWLTRLFSALERTRLLTLLREGPWGCGPINAALRDWLARRGSRAAEWLPGTPILITRTDPIRGLSNGDVGLTVASGKGPRVLFARQGGFAAFSPESLPSHELGFALTVHKSQGSEFQQALIVLPPTGGRRLLTKELIYTGITRAKSLALVSGTAEAFRAAIGRRIVRESGMSGLVESVKPKS